MQRTADGTDPNIIKRGPDGVEWVTDDCGRTFDDVERMVTHPHDILPPASDKEAWRRFMERRLPGDEGHADTATAAFVAMVVAAVIIAMVISLVCLSWHDADIRRCQTAIAGHVPWSAYACNVSR